MAESGRTTLERGLASVLVGLVAAAVLIIGLEPALRSLYPVPQPDGSSAAQVREAMEALPRLTFVLLWGLYAAAALVGVGSILLLFVVGWLAFIYSMRRLAKSLKRDAQSLAWFARYMLNMKPNAPMRPPDKDSDRS